MTPTIGRIVHYHSYGTPGGEYKPCPRAAVVTQVNDDDTVGLCILNPTGLFFTVVVKHAPDDVPTPGMWTWPPLPQLPAQHQASSFTSYQTDSTADAITGAEPETAQTAPLSKQLRP